MHEHQKAEAPKNQSRCRARIIQILQYLGSVNSENSDCLPDITTRNLMAKLIMIQLNNICKDRSIQTALKLNINKCLVWSVMT